MFSLYSLDPGIIEKHLRFLENDVKLILFLQESECPHCANARNFIEKLSSITQKIQAITYNYAINNEMVQKYHIRHIPAIALIGKKDYGIRYYGVPADMELFHFLDDIVDVSRGEAGLSEEVSKKMAQINWPVHLQLFISHRCPYSRSASKLAIEAAIINDFISVDILDAMEFPEDAEKYGVRGIPYTVINEKRSFYGALAGEDFAQQLIVANSGE